MFVYLIPVGLATAAVWSLPPPLPPPYFQFECNNVTAVSLDRTLNFFVKKTLQEADFCPPPPAARDDPQLQQLQLQDDIWSLKVETLFLRSQEAALQ